MAENGMEQTQEEPGVLKLKKPIMLDGAECGRLTYDFDTLSAKDLHEVSKYLKKIGVPVSVMALDYDYQLSLFARAVRKSMQNVELSDLLRLSAADAMKATGLTRNFLLDLDPTQAELGSDE